MRRWAGVLIGAVLLVAALVLAVAPVADGGVDCGTMWSSHPVLVGGVDMNDCPDAVTARRLRVLVAATVGAGVVVAAWPGRRHVVSSADTAARSARVRARP